MQNRSLESRAAPGAKMGDMRIGLDTPEGNEIIRGERVLRRRRLADAAFAVECDLA
jgi:hypothetical protein